jgi:hypothetical protein
MKYLPPHKLMRLDGLEDNRRVAKPMVGIGNPSVAVCTIKTGRKNPTLQLSHQKALADQYPPQIGQNWSDNQ